MIARINLQLALQENDSSYGRAALEAIERSIDQQRPERISASLNRLMESTDDYCSTLLKSKGVVCIILKNKQTIEYLYLHLAFE